jgi:Ssp1 endopeptidase immunity protein Rap1a
MFRILYIIALLMMVHTASAQKPNEFSGYLALPGCKTVRAGARPSADQGYCAGQLRALAYVSQALPPNLRSCVPNGLLNGQLAMVAVHFMETHPERINEDFMALVLQAYREAWPWSPQCDANH